MKYCRFTLGMSWQQGLEFSFIGSEKLHLWVARGVGKHINFVLLLKIFCYLKKYNIMKIQHVILTAVLSIFFIEAALAQFNILERAQKKLEDRAKREVDKKVDETIDKAVDDILTVESKRNTENKNKTHQKEQEEIDKYSQAIFTPSKEVDYDFGATLNSEKVIKLGQAKSSCLIENEYNFPQPTKEEWNEITKIRDEKMKLQNEAKAESNDIKNNRINEIETRLTELRNKYPPKPTGKRTLTLQFKEKDSLNSLHLFAYFDGQTGQQKTISPSSMHLFEWSKHNNSCSTELAQLTETVEKFYKNKIQFCCKYKGSRLYLTKITKVNADHYAISGAFELCFDCGDYKYNFTKGTFKDVKVEDHNYDEATKGVSILRQRCIQMGTMAGLLTLW
jgi:hypothetical protein